MWRGGGYQIPEKCIVGDEAHGIDNIYEIFRVYHDNRNLIYAGQQTMRAPAETQAGITIAHQRFFASKGKASATRREARTESGKLCHRATAIRGSNALVVRHRQAMAA